jgi:hypothetical protein
VCEVLGIEARNSAIRSIIGGISPVGYHPVE